jgi:biotin carboxyl carrier protein
VEWHASPTQTLSPGYVNVFNEIHIKYRHNQVDAVSIERTPPRRIGETGSAVATTSRSDCSQNPVDVRPSPARVPAAEKTDLDKPGHVAALFVGVAGQRAEDDVVGAGQTVATIETMKMQAAITAPKAGSVARVAVSQTVRVEGGATCRSSSVN